MKPTGYVSILHAIDLPDVGGDTAFSSTISAFEALSDGMKKLLRTRKLFMRFMARNVKFSLFLRAPCVGKPQNKRKAFTLIECLSRFCDMTAEESAPLLDYLFDHMRTTNSLCLSGP